MTVASPSQRRIALWLLTCCALVYAMVVLGGVTRLTGSGLSITDWKPIMGVLPPLDADQWEETFARYQESPEFQKINSHMTVADFKGIFWLEYLHRLLGRTIGIVFLAPFLWFLARGVIGRREVPKYLLMFALGGLQGALGWYMVKSGLIDNPRVSQYRLTAHLLAALVIYAYMFWVALGLWFAPAGGRPHTLYRWTLALTALATLTIASGGFVAGLDAGLAFNTFPLMNGQWIPDTILGLAPFWRNLFENLATVQFNHRLLAVITLLAVIVYWAMAMQRRLPRRLAIGCHLLLACTGLQVALGIATLLLRVPVHLAATHQAVAVLVFTAGLYLCHGLREGWYGPGKYRSYPNL
ncbi:MAG: heme A synthase [Gammaproteobacteria bacterium]|nr:MAG: heme A synthase [Gammaproteobacteria bacterium]